MNILYLINELELGGSQLGAIKEITELSKRGHNITVISRNGSLKETFKKVSKRVEVVSLPMYGFAGEIKNKRQFAKNNFTNLLKSIRRLRLPRSVINVVNIIKEEKIDVIYSCQPGPSQVAHIASKITCVPFVMRVQHILANEFGPLFYKNVVNDSYKVSVITEEISEYLNHNYNIDRERICIIPTCIELDQYLNVKSESYTNDIKQLGIKETDTVIVSITTHREDKMMPVKSLIAAVKKLNIENVKIKCILVGDGPCQNIVEELSKEVNENIGESIIFTVGKQMNLQPFLKIADLGVGVGRCAMEFLASGNALVCASHQAFGGLFTKENYESISGYNFSGRNTINTSNDENMYNAIKQYINMTVDEKENIKKFGQEFMMTNYSTKTIIDNIEKLLYDSINKK